jgi:hypothetical protein
VKRDQAKLLLEYCEKVVSGKIDKEERRKFYLEMKKLNHR